MRVSNALSISDNFDFALSRPSSWCNASIEKVRNKSAFACFQAASYLTDPVCKGREFYQRIRVVDALNPEANFLSNLARKVYLCTVMVGWISLAVVTTLPGIALRALGSYLQKNPFIYMKGDAPAKILPPARAFSLLSWNICAVTAGYSISDGGVLPWAFRIDEIINKVVEKDADVNCLYEVFDIQTATFICERLKQKGYNDFYFNIEPKAIGVSSGIFIASKYKIKNPEFTQFPQDALVGRTKFAGKGVFAFDLESQGGSFAKIFSTHLQHSEESQFPNSEEIEARKKQMQIIVDKVNTVRDRCIVVTGDLNLDDDEYRASSWNGHFQKGDRYGSQDKTWGGNEFVAKMDGQRSSCPLNLDHTMIVAGTAREINTTLVKTGFDAKTFKAEALSDHAGLLSQIAV